MPEFPDVYDIATDSFRPMTVKEIAAFRPFMLPAAPDQQPPSVDGSAQTQDT